MAAATRPPPAETYPRRTAVVGRERTARSALDLTRVKPVRRYRASRWVFATGLVANRDRSALTPAGRCDALPPEMRRQHAKLNRELSPIEPFECLHQIPCGDRTSRIHQTAGAVERSPGACRTHIARRCFRRLAMRGGSGWTPRRTGPPRHGPVLRLWRSPPHATRPQPCCVRWRVTPGPTSPPRHSQ